MLYFVLKLEIVLRIIYLQIPKKTMAYLYDINHHIQELTVVDVVCVSIIINVIIILML